MPLPPTQVRFRGFTIIELVVVVALLVVAAGLVIPRLTSRQGLLAEAEVARVASLLESAARRSALTTQLASLYYDDETAQLSVEVALADDPTKFGGRIVWSESPLDPPARLEHIRLEGGQSGGMPLDRRRWRVDFDPSDAGPEVWIFAVELEGERRWTISLASGAASARINLGEAPAPSGDVIDLDANGQRESTW